MYFVWIALLIGTSALAYWRGCREELIAALTILIISVGNPLIDLKAFGPRGVEWIAATGDVLLLVELGYFAIASRMWWAVFAAGFQCLAIFIHAARLADIEVGRAAYIAAYQKYGYFVVGSILYGVWSRSRSPAASSSSPPAAPRSPS